MRTTQQFSITLPLDMAEVVEEKIKSGAYASVSEVMRDGVRALLERDAAIERWLRDEVIAGHEEYMADPSKGISAERILDRIKARRAEKLSGSRTLCVSFSPPEPSVISIACTSISADVSALGVKGRIGFRRQPIAKAMRFEVGLFFKNRPTERCEMLGTRPRRIASSAISRWLQWLIGRSLSDGLSQVIAITAQICSGVYVAGAPSAAHRRAARAPTAHRALHASACANTAPSSATRRVPARSRVRRCCRRHAKSCEPATPTVVRSNGLVPALQRFSLRRQNNHQIGGQPGHRKLPSQPPIRDATSPPIRLPCFVTASRPLSAHLHTSALGRVVTSAQLY